MLKNSFHSPEFQRGRLRLVPPGGLSLPWAPASPSSPLVPQGLEGPGKTHTHIIHLHTGHLSPHGIAERTVFRLTSVITHRRAVDPFGSQISLPTLGGKQARVSNRCTCCARYHRRWNLCLCLFPVEGVFLGNVVLLS